MKTLLNITENFIPSKAFFCDDGNLPWINMEIKELMVEKNLAFRSYCCSNRKMFLFENLTPYRIDRTNQLKNKKKTTTLNCQVG